MPIIRRQLKPSDVYPDDIRYNSDTDTVQRNINGVWQDSPESDPRTQTTLPTRDTADPRCDGAQSIADAIENQISQILTAIDNAQTVATIAGLVLGLFSFGVFAIFINIALAIAGYMLDAGTAAIEAALPPSAYEDLACILYCHMDNNGRINKGDMANIQSEVTDQVGGLGATILNDMLSLAGEGGLNNLAAVGTSTGDCDECACATVWCKYWDFAADAGSWDAKALGAGIFGTLVPGQWNGTDAVDTISSPDLAHHGVYLSRIFATRTVTHINVVYDLTKGFIDSVGGSGFRLSSGDIFTGSVLKNVAFSTLVNGTNLSQDWTGSVSAEEIQLWLFSSRDNSAPYTYGGLANIKAILMEGEGSNPFGTDDCP
jgi:hypothetical protein